jgi:hypothetical protein
VTYPFDRLRLICGCGEVQQYPGHASAFPCAHHAAGGGDGLDAIKAARKAILEHGIFTVQESAGMQQSETAYPTPSLENAIRGRVE